jgi:ribonuclease J
MKPATLTFHGGVNEIGGNKIILKDGDTRVLLDFGMSFSMRDQYYSFPLLSPRNEKELLELGILPDLKGLYRFDSTEPQFDAVFLTHSHMDHAAYISFLKREIPVYCGETAATILNAYSEVRLPSLEFDLEGLTLRTFRTGNSIKLGSLKVEPVHVDHSVPGSYGFIIGTDSGMVVYTGDFRRHGARPSMTEEFLAKAADVQPDVMVTENTNMASVEISSENEVKEKLNSIIGGAPGLILANFACADVDRLRSFFEAAVGNGRQLAVSLRQAYILHQLREDPHLDIPKIDNENILIYQKKKSRYHSWEKEVMTLGKTVDAETISKMQSNVALACSFYDLSELVDVKPSSGSCYILSASEPFNEEMEIDFNRLINWLEHYGLPQYHVHVSGHITPLHLREALETVNPKKIIPVHGNHPELFSKFMRNLKSKVVLPEKEKIYQIR